MKYIFLVFIALTLSFTGCGSSNKEIKPVSHKMPSWYTNPPQSNTSELYALGEGKDKKEAIAEALNYMSSTLSVSISSSYNAKTVIKEGRINSSDGTYKSDIQSDVKEIRISNYEVINAKSLGFKRYAVVIKSNKRKLFESMDQELKQKFSLIRSEEKSLASSNALKKLSFYRTTKESLKSLPNTLIVMNVLNGSFEGDEYISETQIVSSKYHDIVQNISFWVTSSKNAENLKAPIMKAISAKHLKVKQSKSSMNFIISINAKIEQANSYGFTLARSEINIITKDSRGDVIGSNSLNIVGQSSQGYAIAKQNLSYKLNALIQKDGIAKVLGLDI